MFPHPIITVVSASLFITLLIIVFAGLSKLKELEKEEDEREENLKINIFPCRKCGQMVTPIFLKEDKWDYKCSCKNSWVLKIQI